MKKLTKSRRKTYKSPFGVENNGVPIVRPAGSGNERISPFTEEELRFLRSLGGSEKPSDADSSKVGG